MLDSFLLLGEYVLQLFAHLRQGAFGLDGNAGGRFACGTSQAGFQLPQFREASRSDIQEVLFLPLKLLGELLAQLLVCLADHVLQPLLKTIQGRTNSGRDVLPQAVAKMFQHCLRAFLNVRLNLVRKRAHRRLNKFATLARTADFVTDRLLCRLLFDPMLAPAATLPRCALAGLEPVAH